MPSLVEHQRAFAAILSVHGLAGEDVGQEGAIPIAPALQVHRNTIQGVLVNVLRLTYPTLLSLMGEQQFLELATHYVDEVPATSAYLSDYGASFPQHVAQLIEKGGLPYLADVARFDLAIDETLRRSDTAMRSIPLDRRVDLVFPQSLAVLQLTFPAHVIRAAVDDWEGNAHAESFSRPGSHHVAVWASEHGAMISSLSNAAGKFLLALIEGAVPEEALRDAAEQGDTAFALVEIQSEIFHASFCRVQQRDFQE